MRNLVYNMVNKKRGFSERLLEITAKECTTKELEYLRTAEFKNPDNAQYFKNYKGVSKYKD